MNGFYSKTQFAAAKGCRCCRRGKKVGGRFGNNVDEQHVVDRSVWRCRNNSSRIKEMKMNFDLNKKTECFNF